MNNIDYDNLFPTIPEDVSRKIDYVVAENINDTKTATVIPFKKKKKASMAKWIVAAVVICVLLPTSAYAASRVYNAYVVQKDKYEVEINISSGELQSSSAETLEQGQAGEELLEQHITIPDNNVKIEGFKQLKLNYVPEDLKYNEEGPYEGKYTTNPPSNERGMTCAFYKLPQGGLDTVVDYTLESSTWETQEGNTAIHLIRQRGDEQLWIAFTNTNYAALIYVNGFTEDEVKMLADGAALIDSDKECAMEWEKPHSVSGASTNNETRFDSGIVLEVGDSYVDNDLKAEFTIKSISIQDNFDGIKNDGIVEDYSRYISSDGKAHAIRNYIKFGDGKKVLDKIVSQEDVLVKIISLELEVKNISNEVTECVICPGLVEKQGDVMGEFDKYVGDYWCYRNLTYEFFGFETNHETFKNNLINFKPHETATVRVSFALDEDYFDNAYIQVVDGRKEGNAFVSLKDIK